MKKMGTKPAGASLRGLGGALLCAAGCAGNAQAADDSYLVQRQKASPEYATSSKGGGITFFGAVDEGINYIKADNAPGKFQLQSGGEVTSKFGLYGMENLGGGLIAEFKLESGFQADTGAIQDTSSLFNRAAWVGLRSSQWGTLRVGHQLAIGLPLFIDPFGVVSTNSVFAWVGTAVVQTSKGASYNADLGPGATSLLSRVPRAISYKSLRWHGLSGQLMYAANASGTGSANHGAMLTYERFPYYFTASYNQVWSSPVTLSSDATPVAVRNDVYAAAAIYDNGDFVLSTSMTQYAPKLDGDAIARVTTLGAILPEGRHSWRLSLVHRDTSGVRNSVGRNVSSSALGVMAGNDYDLSRHTALYVRAGKALNHGYSAVLLNSAALPLQAGSANPQLGIATTTFTLGMRHNF